MPDIIISKDETLEFDAIIEESSRLDSVVDIDRNNTDYNINSFQTHTGVFDPQDTGEFNIKVNGQELTVKVTDKSTIPNNEGFEHNDLSGNYIGDISNFAISTSQVFDGQYSLYGSAGGDYSAVIRNSNTFNRYNKQIDYEQYNTQSPRNDGDGGIAFVTETSTSFSDIDGYFFKARTY